MVCCSKTAIISSHTFNRSVFGMEIQNFTFQVVTESLHTDWFKFILYRLKIFFEQKYYWHTIWKYSFKSHRK
jgi:hypothetical protein